VQFTSTGTQIVPGGSPSWPNLSSFLHLPVGFCAHYYGKVGNARQIRFAPGGALFVASPTQLSTGGGPSGLSAYVVLPDDNLDGVADQVATFLAFSNPSTNQGMLFANGFFYYQDGTLPGTKIMRLPYQPGELTAAGTPQEVANINVYTSGLHWPKTLDMADDGTIYVGNGGDQVEATPRTPSMAACFKSTLPPAGPIRMAYRSPRASGTRSTSAVPRGTTAASPSSSPRTTRTVKAAERSSSPSIKATTGAFPCCATQGLPYLRSPAGTNCSRVAMDNNSFYIGDTPFGMDFEPGAWAGQWAGRVYVATHGAAGWWTGARIMAIPVDPTTGLPMPSTNATTESMSVGMIDFATGWDDGTLQWGRPAAVTFSPRRAPLRGQRQQRRHLRDRAE
jgi:hypothetical protein